MVETREDKFTDHSAKLSGNRNEMEGKTSLAFKEGPTSKFVSTDAALERTEFPSH